MDAAPSARRWPAGARLVGAAWHGVLGVLWPQPCLVCGAPLAQLPDTRLCADCALALIAHDGPRCRHCDAPGAAPRCARCAARPPAFASLRAPYRYRGPLVQLLKRTKFAPDEGCGRAAAALLAAHPEACAATAGADCIVPVPLGARRRRQRGFNPSAYLADALARACGVPLRHALCRARQGGPQSALGLAQRVPHVAGAFAPRLAVVGVAVLVDDIATSCATADAAATALREAGAATVRVVALARAG